MNGYTMTRGGMQTPAEVLTSVQCRQWTTTSPCDGGRWVGFTAGGIDDIKGMMWDALLHVLRRNWCNPRMSPEACAAYADIAEWAMRDAKRTDWGLLLMGQVGTGKTTIAEVLQRMCAVAMGRHEGIFHPGEAEAYTLYIRTARQIVAGSCSRRDFEALMRKPMLAIDDLGTEPLDSCSFGNYSQPLVELLDYRYSRRLMTVITTNLPPSILSERYGDRTVDRLREMCHVVAVIGESYRMGGRK